MQNHGNTRKRNVSSKRGKKMKSMQSFVVITSTWLGILVLISLFTAPQMQNITPNNFLITPITVASGYTPDSYEPNDDFNTVATSSTIQPKFNDVITNLTLNTTDTDYYSFEFTESYPTFYFDLLIAYNASHTAVGLNVTLYHYFYNVTLGSYTYNVISNTTKTVDHPLKTGWSVTSFLNPIKLIGLPITTSYYIIGIELDQQTKNTFGSDTLEYELTTIYDDLTSILKETNDFDHATELLPGYYDEFATLLNATVDSVWVPQPRNPETPLDNQFMDIFTLLLFKNNIVNINLDYYWNVAWINSPNYDNLTLEVYFPNRTLFTYEIGRNFSTRKLTLEFTAPESGYYYLVVNSSIYPFETVTINKNYLGLLPYNLNWTQQEVTDNGIMNNDDPTNGTWISNNPFERAGLHISKKDVDWYRINATDFQTITITADFFHSLSDINLYLFSDITNYPNIEPYLVGMSETTQNTELIEYEVFSNTSSIQTFYLKVNSTNNDEPRYYNLSILVQDPDDIYEDNDDQQSAKLLLTENKTYSDLFLRKNDNDYFFLTLIAGDSLQATITFDESLGPLNIEIRDADFKKIAETEGVGGFKELSYVATENSVIFLGIVGDFASFTTTGIPYSLTITVYQSDDRFESNNNQNNAKATGEGIFKDLILRTGDEDWYYVYLLAGETLWINVTFDAAAGDIDLYTYDSGLQLMNKSIQNINTGNEMINLTVTNSGIYYIRLQLWEGTSIGYTLQIQYNESDDPYEDNDNLSQATNWDSINASTTASLATFKSRPGDADFYKIFLENTEGIIATATLNTTQGNLTLRLYDANGNLLAESNTTTFQLTEIINSTGFYYLEVLQFEGVATNYTLNITIGLAETLFPSGNLNTIPYTLPTSEAITPIGALDPILVGGIVFLSGGSAVGAASFIAYKKGKLQGLSEKIKSKIRIKKGNDEET